MGIDDDLNVRVDCDPGQRLGDHKLILADLEATLACCHRLMEVRSKAGSDRTIEESLWTTALVKYARCFGTGRRLRLSLESLVGLDADKRAAHKFFMDLRDKHVAHSVNDFEQVRVGVSLSHPDSGKRPRVTAVPSVFVSRLLTSDDGHVRQLRALTAAMRDAVLAQVESTTSEFQKYVSNLTLEQLYAMPEITEARHSFDRVRARRR